MLKKLIDNFLVKMFLQLVAVMGTIGVVAVAATYGVMAELFIATAVIGTVALLYQVAVRGPPVLADQRGFIQGAAMQIIGAVILFVIGISLTPTVIDSVSESITAASSAGDQPLTEIVVPYLSLFFVVSLYGLAGFTGYRGLRGMMD